MTRLLITMLFLGLGVTARADSPPIPMAMPSAPGVPAAPPAKATPLATSPTVPTPIITEDGTLTNDCCESGSGACCRPGLLRGRFLERDAREWPCYGRLKAFLCWKAGPGLIRPCLCGEPYHSPARYYFYDGVDNGSQCANGACAGEGLSAGATGRLRGAVGGEGSVIVGTPLFGGRLRGGCADGNCSGGRRGCHSGEQCCLTGQPFLNNLRFAKDEKPLYPNVIASKPEEFPSSSITDIYSRKRTEPDSQQAQR